jgi:hypothetical protein
MSTPVTHAYRHGIATPIINGASTVVNTTCSCGWRNQSSGPNAFFSAEVEAIEHEYSENPNLSTTEVRLQRAERLLAALVEHVKTNK